eukprot:scaffold184574_cov57-Attheya_sp.AAC.2
MPKLSARNALKTRKPLPDSSVCLLSYSTAYHQAARTILSDVVGNQSNHNQCLAKSLSRAGKRTQSYLKSYNCTLLTTAFLARFENTKKWGGGRAELTGVDGYLPASGFRVGCVDECYDDMIYIDH